MKIYKTILPIACIAVCSHFFISCNNSSTSTDSTKDTLITVDSPSHEMHTVPDTATVPISSSAEAIINATFPDTVINGTAKFETTADGKVKMTIDITVALLANKNLAVHLHEHGDCGDNGKASHGHWNPTNSAHGKWGSAAFHLGDIGNIKLDAKGKGTITVTTDLWTLGGTAGKNILGKAIIVHSGVDDYTTQPTGNAGGKIGCGLIQAK